MKAVVYERYGQPEDVLELREIYQPTPEENEVLVEIMAASVNYSDWAFVRGDPFLSRLWTGLLQPKFKILGTDIAGRIETVGSKVTEFQPGAEVFGEIGDHVVSFRSGSRTAEAWSRLARWPRRGDRFPRL